MIATATKVRTLGEAITWRTAQIGPVVFTNGVFDLVHPLKALQLARGMHDLRFFDARFHHPVVQHAT